MASAPWPTVVLVSAPCKKIPGLASALQANGETPNRDPTSVRPLSSIFGFRHALCGPSVRCDPEQRLARTPGIEQLAGGTALLTMERWPRFGTGGRCWPSFSAAKRWFRGFGVGCISRVRSCSLHIYHGESRRTTEGHGDSAVLHCRVWTDVSDGRRFWVRVHGGSAHR